jgi:hypothetical protein
LIATVPLLSQKDKTMQAQTIAAIAAPAVYPQDMLDRIDPAATLRMEGLADVLRGFVNCWETLDFGVSANCFDIDDRLQAWHNADDNSRTDRTELPLDIASRY